ncbi:hypothetical protein IZY60_00610 [Lutibacter sp. B2]|nr:hypothetical protein [Lutibacter sp. B2]
MIKKTCIILMIFILLFAAYLFNIFSNHNQYISTFKSYVITQKKISQELLTDYYSTHKNIQQKAKHSIISTTLKNLEYEKWLPYMDYIDILVYFSDVLPGNDQELIVALNLSKDVSVIAIYTKINNEYIFTNKIENLLPIQNITFIKMPELNYNSLITDQLLDERLGAFYIEEFIEIFTYVDTDFKSTWKKTKYSDEIFNLEWIDADASPKDWLKIVSKSDITFNEKVPLTIDVSTHITKFKAISTKFPSLEEFKIIDQKNEQEKFYWDSKDQNFLPIKNTQSSNIAQDTNNLIQTFLGLKSNTYPVLPYENQFQSSRR